MTLRSDRRSKSIPALAEHLEDMATIVEHQRTKGSTSEQSRNGSNRKVREAVTVVVFEEEDGTETVSVLGDAESSSLELKGVLHDGLYAMAHEGDDDYTPE